jgi:hypothetical protein
MLSKCRFLKERRQAMASGGSASAARVFAAELMNRGVEPSRALELSAAVLAAYPWARRIGVPSVARQLTARGLDPESAQDFAQTLLALELYDQGACLDEVLRLLREGSGDRNGALAIALDAARIHRELRPHRQMPPQPPRMSFVLNLVGALAILLPLAFLVLSMR